MPGPAATALEPLLIPAAGEPTTVVEDALACWGPAGAAPALRCWVPPTLAGRAAGVEGARLTMSTRARSPSKRGDQRDTVLLAVRCTRATPPTGVLPFVLASGK